MNMVEGPGEIHTRTPPCSGAGHGLNAREGKWHFSSLQKGMRAHSQ